MDDQSTTIKNRSPDPSRSAYRPLSILVDSKALSSFLIGAFLLVAFIVVMAAIQFSTPDMPDNDGYYHIRFASLMRTEGLKPGFPWLPLTVLNPREFADHHFLFHVALIPFTFGDLRAGAKWAAVLFSSLAFLCIWWLFFRQKVPYAALWALGLLSMSEAFLYRMSITRAQSLSLAVLVIALQLLLSRKYGWLLPLGFIYVWLYDAFPLLMVLAGCFVLAGVLIERRLDIRPLVYAGVGLGLGLIINPYFPHNIIFFARHLVPKLSDATAISVGSEWYPYTTGQLLENSPIALVTFFMGVLALGLNAKRMDTRAATGMLAAIVFGFMLFQARRFVEYFPAFALIFATFAWTPLLESEGFINYSFSLGWVRKRAIREGLNPRPIYRRWVFMGIAIMGMLLGSWNAVRSAQSGLKDSQPYTLYASASQWLADHTPAGSRIFQTDWDDFPRLFFYNTRNTYLVGLDPTYMQIYDPELYSLWVQITRGNIDLPSRYIYSRFGAPYILTDLLHKDFIRQASLDPGLKEVYRDQEAVIYEVLDLK